MSRTRHASENQLPKGDNRVSRRRFLFQVAGAGVGSALIAQQAMAAADFLRPSVSRILPGFEVSPSTLLTAMGISVAVGVIAGVAPGWYASRLAPVAALREEA